MKIKFEAKGAIWTLAINNYPNWEAFKNFGYYKPANEHERF